MTNKSLSIKIRKARKQLLDMQASATFIYSFYQSINNIRRGSGTKNIEYYNSFCKDALDLYNVSSIQQLEKLIQLQKKKIRNYNQRICKLQSIQNLK